MPFFGEVRSENSAVRSLMKILDVYANEIEAGRVIVVTDFSLQFLRGQHASKFDWIYLDASHRYEDTKIEIEESLRVIKRGGYLIGDDYDPNPESKQHGVFLAVNEVISRIGAKLILNNSRQFAFQIPVTYSYNYPHGIIYD